MLLLSEGLLFILNCDAVGGYFPFKNEDLLSIFFSSDTCTSNSDAAIKSLSLLYGWMGEAVLDPDKVQSFSKGMGKGSSL